MDIIDKMKEKVDWVKKQTLMLHKRAPETRIASCLSDIEIFTVLYYGRILNYRPHEPYYEQRDRLIVSKGHGGISLYPILADCGFFGIEELEKIGHDDSFLGIIPDTAIPGIETINGSLGHGLGVACGMAVGLKKKEFICDVFIVCGDGELNEGSMWEAVMFAAYHRLDNLTLIVDNNKISMLDYQRHILALEPLEDKFTAFGWNAMRVDGHDLQKLYNLLKTIKNQKDGRPTVIIAETVKGRGVPQLEADKLCHVKSLTPDQIDSLLQDFDG